MIENRKYIAYLIGIEEYDYNIPSLNTPANDASTLGRVLADLYGYEVHLHTGNFSLAEFEELVEHIAEGKSEVQEECIIFYFAGHGLAKDSQDGKLKGYLLPSDAKPDDTFSFIAMEYLYQALEHRSPHHLLVIMDCCFSGAFRWSSGLRKSTLTLSKLSQEQFQYFLKHKSWQVITSASYDEAALDIISGDRARGEKKELVEGHSPFAYALIQGLSGKADRGDGVITLAELYAYLQKEFLNLVDANEYVQMPGQWPLDLHHKGQYIFQINKQLDLPNAPELVASNNPYRGLQSYQTEDEHIFFGREKPIQDLLKKISQQQMVSVIGASGSGKSSLVKAGVVAHLKKDPIWHILGIMRPSKDPFQSLTDLLPHNSQEIVQPFVHLDEFLHQHAQKKVLWGIDQFEELITEATDVSIRNDFLFQLDQIIKKHSHLYVIITLRADFEPQFPKLLYTDQWSEMRYVIPRMTSKELRAAILGPAEARSIFFDPLELVDQIIEEIIDAPGALPLLSFALSELYLAIASKEDKQRTITEDDYKSLGGVVGALRFRADQIYENLSDGASKRMMKNLMLRMVSVEGGELARRRMYDNELIFEKEEENVRAKEVLAHLLHARLLVSDQDGLKNSFYEPAHDELIRGWGSLLNWLEEFTPAKLLLMRDITQATTTWEKSGRKKGLLWTNNPRLLEAWSMISTPKKWKFWDKS